MKEIKRLISGKVRLLCSLKESTAMRNEWDLAPRNAMGEPVSILPGVPDSGPNGYDAAVEKEEREDLRKGIEDVLEGDAEVQGVFSCVWEGVTRPADIARRLEMGEKEVIRA